MWPHVNRFHKTNQYLISNVTIEWASLYGKKQLNFHQYYISISIGPSTAHLSFPHMLKKC
jgi:hypothetical protein